MHRQILQLDVDGQTEQEAATQNNNPMVKGMSVQAEEMLENDALQIRQREIGLPPPA